MQRTDNRTTAAFQLQQQDSNTFAEVVWVQREAVAWERLQEELVAGPPAGLRDAGSHALHGGHALEESRLATEADQLVELGEDAVALDLFFLRKLRHREESEKLQRGTCVRKQKNKARP